MLALGRMTSTTCATVATSTSVCKYDDCRPTLPQASVAIAVDVEENASSKSKYEHLLAYLNIGKSVSACGGVAGHRRE